MIFTKPRREFFLFALVLMKESKPGTSHLGTKQDLKDTNPEMVFQHVLKTRPRGLVVAVGTELYQPMSIRTEVQQDGGGHHQTWSILLRDLRIRPSGERVNLVDSISVIRLSNDPPNGPWTVPPYTDRQWNPHWSVAHQQRMFCTLFPTHKPNLWNSERHVIVNHFF